MKTKLSQRFNSKAAARDIDGNLIKVILPVLDKGPSNKGVYRIWSPLKKGCYIGSTTTLQKRANDHWRYIQRRFKMPYLDFALEVGLENLEFEVLEYFPEDTKKFAPELICAEEKWSRKFAEDNEILGLRHGDIWTEERRINSRSDKSKALLNDPVYLKQQIIQAQRDLKWFQEKLEECELLTVNLNLTV